MENITFASTNQNKFLEVQSILSTRNISVDFSQIRLVEIQSDSLEEIAREKAKTAFAKVGRQVIQANIHHLYSEPLEMMVY